MNQSFAVLGLGKYGKSLALALYEKGVDVLVADKNASLIQEFADKVTAAVVADLENEDELKALGLEHMDVVIVATSSNLAASILTVLTAREEGVPYIVAKSSSTKMTQVLKKVGADRVIDPEEESGIRSARVLTSSTVLDVFDVDEHLCMAEIRPKDYWVGKSLKELNLRRKHNINVVAAKQTDGRWINLDPDTKLSSEENLLVVTDRENLEALR